MPLARMVVTTDSNVFTDFEPLVYASELIEIVIALSRSGKHTHHRQMAIELLSIIDIIAVRRHYHLALGN
jgi:hypothetical protein